ncbi:hypothetical protein [Nocardia transvalensis]|uniref:hypothetical protein n=1 Tax=Nocardia transvalensis TaxID=37333 RepID=UPI001892E0A9|nr:hypothetical protein [Nocardia transvalensis]MBF6333572.1 hypothetical protein [Nocardia transvalensis]
MPTSSPGRGSHAADVLLPIALVIVVFAVLFAALPGWRDTRLRWLADHHILVAAAQQPLVTLPGNVAGLDGHRLALLVVILALLVVCTASWVWRTREKLIQRRLSAGDRG